MSSLNITSIFILLFTIVLGSSNTYAQHNHSNHQHDGMHEMNMKQAPNGGELKDAGKYRVEMVAELFLREDHLVFYIYKRNLKPVSTEGIFGTINISYKNGTTLTDTLQAKGTNHFVAQLENKEAFQCMVTFLVKDKTFSTVFSHHGLGLNSLGKYYCPMHPDVESNIPGKCSKCKMELLPKEQDHENSQQHNH